MAELDVSELMTDPDFITKKPFTVIRKQQVVDQHGRAQPGQTNMQQVIGAIYPISARTMNLMQDQINVNGAIEIYTKYRLEGPSNTTYGDTIEYAGNTYLVANVQWYGDFGAGFVHAVCQLRDLLAASPNPTVVDHD